MTTWLKVIAIQTGRFTEKRVRSRDKTVNSIVIDIDLSTLFSDQLHD